MTAARCQILVSPVAATWKTPKPGKLRDDTRTYHAGLPDHAVTMLVSLPDATQEGGAERGLVKDETSRLVLPSFKILGASCAIRQALVEKCRMPATTRVAEIARMVKQEGPISRSRSFWHWRFLDRDVLLNHLFGYSKQVRLLNICP